VVSSARAFSPSKPLSGLSGAPLGGEAHFTRAKDPCLDPTQLRTDTCIATTPYKQLNWDYGKKANDFKPLMLRCKTHRLKGIFPRPPDWELRVCIRRSMTVA
jgi:hypothetical protein